MKESTIMLNKLNSWGTKTEPHSTSTLSIYLVTINVFLSLSRKIIIGKPTIFLYWRKLYSFEPYLRQSVQKLVFKYDQEYTAVGINKFDGLLRDADITTKEFWISFYNASDNTL